MRRPLLLLLLLAAIAAYALQWQQSWGSVPPPAPIPDASRAASNLVLQANPALVSASVDRMVEALHATYRLQPDRRCVEAFGELEAWRTGMRTPEISARFAADHWVLETAEGTVAELPELPDFDDC